MILALKNSIRSYAWGSRFAIADLLGEPSPTAQPQAELWIGAHPDGSSLVIVDHRPMPLCRLITSDPEFWLGAQTVARFGPRLPFLLKVLAAASPLSLQAHPSLEQARRGFAREEARGIPRDARERNYRDENHKPELLCALSPFDAFSGFQPWERVVETMRFVDCAALTALVDRAAEAAPTQRLSSLFASLLRQPAEQAKALASAAVECCQKVIAQGAGPITAAQAAWIPKLSDTYPGDVGVVTALMLNLVHLEPGQAIFLASQSLHSYLCGVAVELTASSDNVLRGGLTPKHVDVDELLAVLDYGHTLPALVATSQPTPNKTLYPVPVGDFELHSLAVSSLIPCHVWGPELLLCTEGSVNVMVQGGDYFILSQGGAAFVGASSEDYVLGGRGTIYRATVGAL
jgi:mannose-6-phosphate isomerase